MSCSSVLQVLEMLPGNQGLLSALNHMEKVEVQSSPNPPVHGLAAVSWLKVWHQVAPANV